MNAMKPLVVACAMALAVPSLQAQVGGNAPADDAEALEQIVVTGSNLKGVDLAEAQPVTIIDADDIAASGAQTITELMQNLTQSGGGTGNFTAATSGTKQEDSPAGSAGISLRGLGTASTLTLVNGRRIAVSSFANGSENFVDVNAIPLAAVDRVEILTTGASAIYGADAVAGVVNFILRSDFDGVRLSVSSADSTRGTDESRHNANLVWGKSGERARGLVILDIYQRNALYDRDRAISAREPRPSQQGIFPSFNDLFAQEFDLVERSCPDDQRFDDRPGFPMGRFGAYCELNRNAFTATDPESDRLGAYGTFSLDLDPQWTWFNEVALQKNSSLADSEPAPFSEEELYLDHPNMPAELRQRLLAAGVDPDFPIFAWGRFPDARTIDVESRTWRVVSGLRGSFGDWGFEAAVNGARSNASQEAVAGIYNVARFRAALRGELCADGTTTCAPGSGGLYYNPFGGQLGNSAQVLDLVRESVPRDGKSELFGVDAKLTGNWLSTAAGPVSWAFGIESRREQIVDAPSALATADPDTGEVPVYGFGSTAVSAERDQAALFAEALVPLVDGLDLRLAARYDHYSDFGGDINPAASLRWQANDRWVLRGGWNSSFRAPSLAQVGAGTTLSSGSLPCAEGGEFFDTFCDGFAEDDFYLSEVYGNPDLEAETAKAWYLGSVFQLAEQTSVSIDYWNFRHRNLVDIDALELFRQALVDPTLLARRGQLPAGQIGIETRNGQIGSPIEEVHLSLVNIGTQNTDGIDLSLEHGWETDTAGDFDFFFDATWTHSFERSESCGGDDAGSRRGVGQCSDGLRLVERIGEFRYPEWLASTGVTWTIGALSSKVWADYTDGYYDDDQRVGVPNGRRIPSWTTLNASLSYDLTPEQWISLGLRNLGDRDPPLALGSAANFDQFNHDSVGRLVTLSYQYRF
ncbi:MAG: TonB-dependent receptor [Ahniella sp.]|nr:TonB-dependent receptor [Ahniella sp.]